MFKQFQKEQSEGTVVRIAGGARTVRLRTLALAALAGYAFALAPLWLPALSAFLSNAAPHTFWYISRASGFVAFGLLWLSMLAGLGITSRLGRIWPGAPSALAASYELHRFASFVGIGFTAVHILVLMGDQYMNYTLAQLLVPFMGSNFKPEWVGFGQIAFYVLLLVSYTFYARDRIGVHVWRLIHMFSFALFLMALLHSLYSGTDSSTRLAQAIYWTAALTVAGASIYRLLALRPGRGRHKASFSVRKLVAHPGRAQARIPAQVPAHSPTRQSTQAQARPAGESQPPPRVNVNVHKQGYAPLYLPRPVRAQNDRTE